MGSSRTTSHEGGETILERSGWRVRFTRLASARAAMIDYGLNARLRV